MNVAQPPCKENSQIISSSINSSGSSFGMWGCTFLNKCILFCYLFCFPFSYSFSQNTDESIAPSSYFDNGITLTAPPRPFKGDPMGELTAVCADWVALIPYGFIRKGSYEVHYNMNNYQWWGETSAGIEKSIQLAKKNQLKIMLKPQLWMMHNWIGDFEIKNKEGYLEFCQSYENYILHFAKMAEKHQVEMFCIATEFKRPLKDYPQLLDDIIKKIRAVYSGKIVYAANWDNYEHIPIWDQVDYIGINAYFPLSEDIHVSTQVLRAKWKDLLSKMESFACDRNKEVWFTEYGYLSVDGAAGRTWILEDQLHQLPINEKAQSEALSALYQTVSEFDFLQGGFLWKWFPEGQGHEGYPKKDYTPQNKLAEKTIQEFFCP